MCSSLVSPLLATPRPFPLGRYFEGCDIGKIFEKMSEIMSKPVNPVRSTNAKKLKYGKIPPKLVVDTPWECLCVDLIGPYTLRGNNGSEIDFMCCTMIDPASSWLEMVSYQ